MGEIKMSAWGALTPQQKYDYFRQGYRYRTDYNVMTYGCNTCYPNVPDGFSSTRPAGSSSYTYTGYGISTGSLDEAWDKYVVVNGGKTVAMTQQEQADLAAKLAAEEAARVAAEAAAAEAAAAEQLRLKEEMLASETTKWASEFQLEAEARLAAEVAAAEAAAKLAAETAAAEEAAKLADEKAAEAKIVAANLPTETAPPVTKCPEGTTRTVKCPKDPNKIITQRCVNGAWVTLPADETACEKTGQGKIILFALIIAIVLIFLAKAVK